MGGPDAMDARRVTMAFLFTDIVGSTALWERFPDSMPAALRRHDDLLGRAVDAHDGTLVHEAGDGVIASFPTVAAAAAAAVRAQADLLAADWSDVGDLTVRMGVHCGDVVMREGKPYGWALNFGARFSDVGSGGQILVSRSAADALAPRPEGWVVAPIATVHLRDIAEPVVVHQLTAPGLPDRFPGLRDVRAPASLPVPPGELVGRDADLALLERLMASHRLLTLVGPPGVGTSRLGAEFVNRMLPRFTDGAFRVDVAASTGDVADAIAGALGVRLDDRDVADAVAESLAESFAGRRVVVLLDLGDGDVERLAELVESLLLAAPSITVVCTGRRPLGASGEVVHRVEPLSVDDAVHLLALRAPGEPTAEDVDVLRDIARELDGLPLGLEFVAAAARVYSWSEVRDVLRDADGARDEPQLRAVAAPLAVGLDDLSAPLRSMLTASTVFAGRFDRNAFETVCAPGLDAAAATDGLGRLVERSLVVREASTDRTWFRLLRPVRDVLARDAEDGELRAAELRLEQWAVRFARDAADGLRGPHERLWNRRLETQLGNLRVAFDRSTERGALETAAPLATSLWDYGFMRFDPGYLDWSKQLAERFPDAPPELIGPVHGVAALGCWIADDAAGVAEHARRALELEDEHGLAFDLPARLALISAAIYSGATSPPERVYAESAAYQLGRPEPYFHVNVETQNAVMANWLGDHDTALHRAVEAVRLARESENASSIAFALWSLGEALAATDPVLAETHAGRALDLARDVGNKWVVALAQMSLVSIRRRTAGALAAAPILLDLIEVLVGGGHRTHLWSSLRLASVVLADLGEDELSVQVASWVRGVGLVMPAFGPDRAAFESTRDRILADRGADWVARLELMSSTWTPATATGLVREALARRLDR